MRLSFLSLQIALVSIPHRYGKNHRITNNLCLLAVVSIPHRYGKNDGTRDMRILMSNYVSIPHRYGKNDGYIESEDAVVEAFPFLIGTVRTYPQSPPCVIRPLWFPFLIGTVRTYRRESAIGQRMAVSIPHRYGKNPITGATFTGTVDCFHSS